jgi:hypothetical protein
MTSLAKFVVQMSGWEGGPGVNVLTFSSGTLTPPWTSTDVQTVYDEIHTMYDDNKNLYAPNVDIEVLPQATIFESTTGDITNVITVPTPDDIISSTGTSGDTSRGQCICAAYYTDVWVGGKRLRGRSFFGPIARELMTPAGLVGTGAVAQIQDKLVAMTSGVGPRLAVYHRPTGGASTDGYYGDVVTVIARGRPSNLRSRQD